MEYEVIIAWSWQDLQALRPKWTQVKCEQTLIRISKTLKERSVETGWDIIRDLLSYADYESHANCNLSDCKECDGK